MSRFSHIDLRVTDMGRALPFFERFLPEVGFTRTFHSAVWKVFASEGDLPEASYFAIMEDPNHQPNENIIAFWAESRAEVDRLAQVAREAGGKLTSGPQEYPISPTYYAVYFEDPSGNHFEVVHRLD